MRGGEHCRAFIASRKERHMPIPSEVPTVADQLKALEVQGVTSSRATGTSTSTVSLGPVEKSTTLYTVRTTWKLPGAVPLTASFTPLGFMDKVVSIFKKRLLVGDPIFDDHVNVSTKTPDVAQVFLKVPGIADGIAGVVTQSGTIRVDRSEIEYVTAGPASDAAEPDMATMLRFVTEVLGLAKP
jgi:hypothetical protein